VLFEKEREVKIQNKAMKRVNSESGKTMDVVPMDPSLQKRATTDLVEPEKMLKKTQPAQMDLFSQPKETKLAKKPRIKHKTVVQIERTVDQQEPANNQLLLPPGRAHHLKQMDESRGSLNLNHMHHSSVEHHLRSSQFQQQSINSVQDSLHHSLSSHQTQGQTLNLTRKPSKKVKEIGLKTKGNFPLKNPRFEIEQNLYF
jgi:hypothetical protein